MTFLGSWPGLQEVGRYAIPALWPRLSEKYHTGMSQRAWSTMHVNAVSRYDQGRGQHPRFFSEFRYENFCTSAITNHDKRDFQLRMHQKPLVGRAVLGPRESSQRSLKSLSWIWGI